jgi:hypothetical protein
MSSHRFDFGSPSAKREHSQIVALALLPVCTKMVRVRILSIRGWREGFPKATCVSLRPNGSPAASPGGRLIGWSPATCLVPEPFLCLDRSRPEVMRRSERSDALRPRNRVTNYDSLAIHHGLVVGTARRLEIALRDGERRVSCLIDTSIQHSRIVAKSRKRHDS